MARLKNIIFDMIDKDRMLTVASGIWGFFFLVFFYTAVAERVLTDAQKRDIVQEMYQSYKKGFPGVTDILPEQMPALYSGGIIIIDVRKKEEQVVSMLPGAVSEKMFLKNPDMGKGKTVVAYCTIGYRSGVFAKNMATQGMPVLNLSGGILAWALSGGSLYDANGETKRIHVYGEKWNYAPKGYETVVFGFFQKLLK